MEEVNLVKLDDTNITGEYQDADNPDTYWRIVDFEDDRDDCLVCLYPVEPGRHYVNSDNLHDTVHRWCARVTSR